MTPFNPKFDVKTKATAIAHYQGPKTPRDPEYDNDIGRLHEFLVREKWKGLLTIGYVGNGGVSEIMFTENKPATPIE